MASQTNYILKCKFALPKIEHVGASSHTAFFQDTRYHPPSPYKSLVSFLCQFWYLFLKERKVYNIMNALVIGSCLRVVLVSCFPLF